MHRDRWVFPQLAREATKNVFDTHSRLYGLLVVAVLIGVAIPLYSAWESGQLLTQLHEEANQGRNVLTISALDQKSPAEISRRSCEGLTHDSDVLRAGVRESQGTSDFSQLGTLIPVTAVSVTLLPELGHYGAVVGNAIRKTGPPFHLVMPDGTVQTAAVGTTQPDVIGTASSVAVGLSPDVTESTRCFVVLDPLARAAAVSDRLVAELESTGGALIADDQFSEPRDPIETYLVRPDRFLPLLLAFAGAITAGAMGRLRTGEWAAYRMSGTSSRSLLIIQLLEQASIAGCLVVTASLTTAIVWPRMVSPLSTVLEAVAAGALWVVVSVLVCIDIPFRTPTTLAKDR
ncbi:hypothetical protein [Glaciihabitans sp. UYNi722]|uniref:hypothetical protein n=1 Tax=Glaciihabitans sp. UYNi722 TaxID=3156344 RepID=UPI003390D3E5